MGQTLRRWLVEISDFMTLPRSDSIIGEPLSLWTVGTIVCIVRPTRLRLNNTIRGPGNRRTPEQVKVCMTGHPSVVAHRIKVVEG